MKGFIVFYTLVSTLLYFETASGQESNVKESLIGKQVFEGSYPKILSFRSDRWLLNSTYDNWEKRHIHYDGVTKKYLNEEVNMPLLAAQWANTFVKKNPEKLSLVHLNGEGRSVNDEATFKLYFPGHWVYEKGSFPVHDISKNQSKIILEDVSPFSLKAYTVHGKDIGVAFKPHDILLVKIDENGNRIWNQSEFATIINIDYETNEIEIKRGQYGSKPLDFRQYDTYVAPIAGDIWGGNLMYYYNLSSACPLDQNGQSAADVFVGEMKDWFGKAGILENLDGIGFDVNYFEVKHTTWDCNNDGQIDNGFVEGKNIWREGDINFLQKIRETFGSEFIITADGWKDDMQRAVGILNGMETEGLCRWNDGFRQISRTINQHTYWNLHNTVKYKFGYITSKLRNPADEMIGNQLRRMGLGLSCCLGVAYAPSPDLDIPEMFGGRLNQPNWLGQPLGPMQYVLGDQEDLLMGKGLRMTANRIQQLGISHQSHNLENGQLTIKGSGTNPRENMFVQGPELKVESGDLLIFFEVKDIDGFVDLKNDNKIPRKINVKLKGLPEYPEEPMRGHLLYNDLAGFMGKNGYTPLMFYFRNVGVDNLQIIFEVEEQGAFAIKNLQAFNSPCLISREFEKGLVIVNPSLESINFNLNQVIFKKMKYQRLDTPVNNRLNLKIIDNNSVNVPALDALFLLKD
ncbi:hypothetical protein [Litoribaculum gwangyangense]|uniref:Uncharacterized protein n=1 Tax=Litoribaculum gwangyangense TaxID=1130722 RepID=A0ABP9CME9_9FLAO